MGNRLNIAGYLCFLSMPFLGYCNQKKIIADNQYDQYLILIQMGISSFITKYLHEMMTQPHVFLSPLFDSKMDLWQQSSAS